MIKKRDIALAIVLLLGCIKWSKAQSISDQKIDSIFALEKKYIDNAWHTVRTTGKMPRSTSKGYQSIADWTSGFFAGNIWLTYKYTKDEALRMKGETVLKMIAPNQFYTNDHDIGFMIYCGFGPAYTITQNPVYKKIIVQASKTALARYSPVVKSIMSWNPNPGRDWKFPVIIDNMMNLEMLLKATELTKDSSYYKVAIAHAKTTMKNQYRADYSCVHVVDYNPLTGTARKRDWNNGNSNVATAAWSRGQGWGLYGFAFMYRDTRKIMFLHQAEHIADYILDHPNMPKDMVPYWDFNAPLVPTMRDASAAALLASGLIELSTLSEKNGKRYFKAAEKILNSLSSPIYLNTSGEGIFLIRHATGNFIQSSELDAGLIYADYYFLEALSKYQRLKKAFEK